MEVIGEIGNSIHPSIQLEPPRRKDANFRRKCGSRKFMLYIELYTNSMLRMFHLRLLCWLRQHYLGNKKGQFDSGVT